MSTASYSAAITLCHPSKNTFLKATRVPLRPESESFRMQVNLLNEASSEETGCGGKQLAIVARLAVKGQ